MSFNGKVKKGMMVLPRGTKMPQDPDVKVETLDLLPESDPRIAEILKLAKPRPHWPRDFALNHAHHVKGRPKKA
jgi:hypothetical protein